LSIALRLADFGHDLSAEQMRLDVAVIQFNCLNGVFQSKVQLLQLLVRKSTVAEERALGALTQFDRSRIMFNRFQVVPLLLALIAHQVPILTLVLTVRLLRLLRTLLFLQVHWLLDNTTGYLGLLISELAIGVGRPRYSKHILLGRLIGVVDKGKERMLENRLLE
jgi:hypothetical protein